MCNLRCAYIGCFECCSSISFYSWNNLFYNRTLIVLMCTSALIHVIDFFFFFFSCIIPFSGNIAFCLGIQHEGERHMRGQKSLQALSCKIWYEIKLRTRDSPCIRQRTCSDCSWGLLSYPRFSPYLSSPGKSWSLWMFCCCLDTVIESLLSPPPASQISLKVLV